MDRFGDFEGDTVFAPVREAAAMTLGASARATSPDAVRMVMDLVFFLLTTRKISQWEVRHAAFPGLRYVLIVKRDMAEQFLNQKLESITDALRDQENDVRAVASEALLPILSKVAKLMACFVPRLVTTLWEALLDLDGISSSTSSVMRLLCEPTACPSHPLGVANCNRLWLQPEDLMNITDDDEETRNESQRTDKASNTSIIAVLVELVRRLRPFWRHNSKAVRCSAVNLLQTLAAGLSSDELLLWVRPLSTDLFSRLFRNIPFESESDILESTQQM